MLIIDTCSGTVLAAKHCVFVPDGALTEAEWEAFDSMSDSEVCDLARVRGCPVLPATGYASQP